jgi:LSD1 subclass zinc finger protein
MEIVKTSCPQCQRPLEFPRDFDNVICASCGSAFKVREYKGTINLSAAGQSIELLPSGANEAEYGLAVIESRLTELDELIAEVNSDIEDLKSKAQSAPLQKGCSFFGLFLLVITVIALFMPLGRKYFGNWLFYLALAAVVLVGIRRIRRKLQTPAQIAQLSEERRRLEDGLAQLEAERSRVLKLKEDFLRLQPRSAAMDDEN